MDEMPIFDMWHWFWQVGDDTTRYWSSAAGAYVPATETSNLTKVPDEAQLIAVLTHLGLAHP